MIRAVLGDLLARGVERAIVGTSNAALGGFAFYQKAGFRLLSIERDFFSTARGYPRWMEERGIRLLDMALTLRSYWQIAPHKPQRNLAGDLLVAGMFTKWSNSPALS
jgi:hypothetical protein